MVSLWVRSLLYVPEMILSINWDFIQRKIILYFLSLLHLLKDSEILTKSFHVQIQEALIRILAYEPWISHFREILIH